MTEHGGPDTLEGRRDPRFGPRSVLAAVAVAALVGGGVAATRHLSATHDAAPDSSRPSPAVPAVPMVPAVQRAAKTVPFRDLAPTRPALGRERTPYDSVSASGRIPGTAHPGDVLAFDVALQAPGLVSLLPCPDYTVTIGTLTTTRQLNCAQVPFYASLVRSSGHVTSFRPVLPAGTQVLFRMHVTVPDQPGRQQVRWSLVGPRPRPGFSGFVDVTSP